MLESAPAPALRRLVAAHAVSRAGDFLYNVSLVVYIYTATGSLTWVAATSVARLIPAVLLAPIAGVLADRFDRRRVVVTSQLLGAAAMLGTAALVACDAPIQWIPVAAAVSVAVTSPAGPALTALLTHVVPEADRASANSLVGLVENAAIVVGPAAGAVVLLLGPSWVPFVLNALTFAVGAAIVAGIRAEQPNRSSGATPSRDGASLRRDLRDGLVAAARPGVRGIVGWTTVAYLLLGVQVVLVAPVSVDLLRTGGWGAGCLEAAAGLGGVLAAVWLKRRSATASMPAALPLGALLSAAGLAALVLLDLPPLAWSAIAVAGAGALLVDVAGMTQLMARVPAALIGRVDGLVGSIAVAAVVAGNAVGAAAIGTAGIVGGTLCCVVPIAVLSAARWCLQIRSPRLAVAAPASIARALPAA